MSNFNFNNVILGGRLTSDPELKQTLSGVPVCTFGIAVNRRYQRDGQNETDFFNCVAWRSTGEFINKYFGKGSSVCVVGSIQNRSWTDSNGNKRYATDIVVDEAYFVDSKADSVGTVVPDCPISRAESSEGQSYMPEAYQASVGQNTAPNFEKIKDDGDLPF